MLATSIVGPGTACHMLSVFHFGFGSQLEEIKTGIANAKVLIQRAGKTKRK